ncbi:MAG: hypothetical protein EPO22_09110 [Dehalococcoidia bacterium]|nr:MAG: hypothetical protein EPO22_09110 [Dehalococcoidia bacterium]
MLTNHDRSRRMGGAGLARRLSRRCWSMLLAGTGAAAVLASACSSGSSSKDATATSGVSAELTAVTGAPTPGPSPTPIDPSSMSYQSDGGPLNTYRIDIPQGWQHEDPGAPGGYERRYYYTVADVRQAAITVWCQPSKTIDQMMSEDNIAVGGRKGTYGVGAAPTATIGGLSGRIVDYNVDPAGVPIEARTLYLTSSSCGWRIVLYAYSRGGRDRWAPLFERVAQTFREVSGPPSG